MARLIPALPPRAAFGAGVNAELALLYTLEQGLSGAYSLFHSVYWSRGVGEQEQHRACRTCGCARKACSGRLNAWWSAPTCPNHADYASTGARLAAGPAATAGAEVFGNRLQVVADVSVLAGQLQQDATRLSAGLATWVPRMQVPSGLVRVVGTAGSGKTQLALRLLKDADAAGLKAAYLCFNRALADHIQRVALVRTPTEIFYEYAVRVVRSAGKPMDFLAVGAFDAIAKQCIAHFLETLIDSQAHSIAKHNQPVQPVASCS